ncbi:MSCRAMM family protein [Anaerotignum sp.]|uniref:MSCRAMM family protein n=1 Tax=Anaerotignum sp. TaxID=2039241 RepID=UPI002714EA5C|nr:carboxypeptidase regulatory-like domain-containing protein [Anaerotignum sp.]
MAFKELYNLGYTPTFEVTGREEKTENLNLTVNLASTAGILSGTVSSGGSGLEGATVKVYDVNDNPIEHTNTGGNGQFTIANLPVGSYKVTAIKAGYLLPLTTPISIQQNKKTSVDINLTADPDNNLNVVYGIIRKTEDETPLQNAVVSLYSNLLPEPVLVISSTTNNNGEFLFGLIPTGEYYVTASKLGYYTNESALIELSTKEFAASEISLIADPAANTGTISGFIKEQATGVPIGGAGVALYSVVNEVETVVATTRTNVSGKYLFTNVNPGTYLVKSTKQEEVV